MNVFTTIDVPSGISFQLWYLDDGTFAGTRFAVAELLELFYKHGPSLVSLLIWRSVRFSGLVVMLLFRISP